MLKKTVQILKRATAVSSSNPAAGMIFFDAKDKTLRTYNSYIFISTPTADITATESFAVQADTFYGVVSRLPDEPIVEQEIGSVNIKTKQGSYKIQTSDTTTVEKHRFSNMAETVLELNAKDFIDIASKADWFSSEDQAKPVLRSVLLKIKSNMLHIYAMDGYSVYKRAISVLNVVEDASYTVPIKNIVELVRTIDAVKDEKETINIHVGKKCMFAESGDFFVACMMNEVSFPDLDKLIPSEFEFRVSIDTIQLLSALDRISLCSDKEHNTVKMITGEKSITIETYLSKGNHAQEILDADVVCQNVPDLYLSSKKLQLALRSIRSPVTSIAWNANLRQMLLVGGFDFETNGIMKIDNTQTKVAKQ